MKEQSRQTAMVAAFTVAIDNREKRPYTFAGIRADASAGNGAAGQPLTVSTSRQHLPTGDYSIAGHEDEIAVERKSLADLYATLGQHRDRFEREHERLAEMPAAAVVIESDWGTICDPVFLFGDDWRSELNPKTVFRTALSWMRRYRVPWIAAGNRRLAEVTTFRFLDLYFRKELKNGQT